MPCDNFFESHGIPYEDAYANLAVYTAHHDNKDQRYAKWLIICWFAQTHGVWSNDGSFDQQPGRDAMRDFLEATAYDTFEQLLADPDYGGTHGPNPTP